MQTCSRCSNHAPDSSITCPTCQADLREFSESAVALKRMIANPRIRAVRILVANDACPVCQNFEGNYAKNAVPALPIPGCSCPGSCNCFYEPILEEIYP